MTSTAAAAFPPAEYLHDEPVAELRHVISGSRQHGRRQQPVDVVSLEVRRGEVTSLLSRHDTSAGRLLDLLDGRASATWGSVHRAELAARVQPGYGIYPRLSVRQNMVITQRRSGRAADLGWIDQVTEALELGGMLGYYDAPGAASRRARWAVARSLGGGPRLLLVDHVSTAGAWPDTPGLMDALRLATHRLRVAAVVATRDPWTAAATDRVVRMNRGKVLDDTGAP